MGPHAVLGETPCSHRQPALGLVTLSELSSLVADVRPFKPLFQGSWPRLNRYLIPELSFRRRRQACTLARCQRL